MNVTASYTVPQINAELEDQSIVNGDLDDLGDHDVEFSIEDLRKAFRAGAYAQHRRFHAAKTLETLGRIMS